MGAARGSEPLIIRGARRFIVEDVTPIPDFDRLLAAARRGDDPAWAQLYRELAGPLLGYLRGQGADDPEDLVGEVFLAVVRGLPRFTGAEAGFRAWVFTIAHRRLTDQRRARGRRRLDTVESASLEPATPAVSLEAEVLAELTTGEVVALLGVLTDDQREVLLLRLVAGLTTAEVAELTGRDAEAVKGLAKRGLAQLRRRFAPSGVDDPTSPAPESHLRSMTEER